MATSKRIRILYIEDDPGLARLMQKRLGKAGYSVDIASDGAEGITKYETDSYDILFVDQTLPTYDGLEVLRILGSRRSLAPTIMITGTGDERVAVEAMKLGACDYIVKDTAAGYLELLPSVIAKALQQRLAMAEKQQAENALRESEEKYRTILENITEGYFENDLRGNLTFFNDSLPEVYGYTREELMHMNYRQFMDEENARKVSRAYNNVYTTGKPNKEIQFEITRKDGTKRYLENSVSFMRDAAGQPMGFRGISRDITERKKVEEALRESEEKYRTVLEDIHEGYFEVDLAGNYTFVNDALCNNFRYTKEELLGMGSRQYQDEANAKKTYQAFNELYRTGKLVRALESEHIRKDGTKGMYELSAFLIRDAQGKTIGFRGTSRDVTERKKMEKALRESEERFRQFFENEPEYCYMISPKEIILDVNNAALNTLGYTKEELIGEPFAKIYSPDSLPKMKKLYTEGKKTGRVKNHEMCIVTKDGTRRTVLLSAGAVRDAAGKILYGVSVQRDITDHVSIKEALQKTEEHLRVISEGASDGFLYIDKEGIIMITNERMKAILGDPQPEGKSLSAFFDAENQRILAQNLKARWEGKGTVYEIVLTDRADRRHDLLVSGTPYRDRQGAIQGAFGIYHEVTHERESARILSEHKEALKNSFFGIAEALSKVIEDRDPYTSGHSAGVAGLAEAIARTMGFPEDHVTGIYIAGVLHDIGKMAVPVEILVKPGRLSDMEMSLIQIHPQAGYEILKGIEFPWPVAQAALQHHERMDGSGYPQKLRGDELILEARILAVADVVDAMTHHRPYRPAFSLRDAIEEIKKGRGRIYDPQVVDACLEILEGKEPFVISEYSTISTSPQFRRGSMNSSALPTTTRMRSAGTR
jgi:PAS domain S-box-containing protein/putative nucleotidyltransferase with HDIG domain